MKTAYVRGFAPSPMPGDATRAKLDLNGAPIGAFLTSSSALEWSSLA